MTTSDAPSRSSPDEELLKDHLTPGQHAHAEPAQIAREQFVHGLLSYLHLDHADRQRQRVRATLDALHAQVEHVAPPAISFPCSRWRTPLGVAAALLLVGALFVYLVPSTPSATAMVQSSIAAAANAGDRRYLVRVMPPLPPPSAGPNGQTKLVDIGEIDLRGSGSSGSMLVRATNPLGDRVAFGRDAVGAWSVRPDGQVSRLGAAAARPRWIELGESTILLDSVESLLAALTSEYEPKRLEPATLDGSAAGELFDRIRATRRDESGPEPQRIEVWIDRQTRLAQRVELHWPDFKARSHEPGSSPLAPDHAGEPGRPHRPGGPDQGFGPAPDHPDDFDDGPPPPGRAPFPPPRDGRRPRPPLDPDGRGDRPPPRAHPAGNDAGPDRPDGPFPPRGPRPRFLDGPPDFGHQHRPPPRMIVFELTPAQPFVDDWFAPEAHTQWVKDARNPD